MNLRCPHCQNAFAILDEPVIADVTCPSCKSKISIAEILTSPGQVSQHDTRSARQTLFEPGDKVAHFQIKDLLGTGGFGSVYSAYDSRLQRNVAVKVPRLESVTTRQAETFIHEARAAAQLRDPNIVTVHEIGRHEQFVYIVSDLIDGITLKQWAKQNAPSLQRSAQMISKIAKAIHKAHLNGVIHRDLKPTNIIVDLANEPHVTDFGLAKREDPEEITVTTSGEVIGTPAYMSPEQALGMSEQADRRTDVYSLGVMLYELIAGKRPFRGESGLLIDEIIAGSPTSPREWNQQIPADLEAINLKALAREPGDRFVTALEFAEELDRYQQGLPTLTRPPSSFQKFARQVAHRKLELASLLLLGTLLVIMVIWLFKSEVSEFQRHVQIAVEPADANVALVSYDPERPAIDYDQVWQPRRSGSATQGIFEIDLSPGWYLVEAWDPRTESGTEVLRYVPGRNEQRRISNFQHSSWQEVEGRVLWQPIVVQPIEYRSVNSAEIPINAAPPLKLQLVPGGTFLSGSDSVRDSDDRLMMPYSEETLGSFWIAETEVSVAQFRAVMGYVPEQQGPAVADDTAVTNLSWEEALAFCEKTGTRLPIFDEYCYAATNGGRTRFPWGDQPPPFPVEGVARVGTPADDSMLNAPVFGLYSNAAEWTLDPFLPIDGASGRVDTWPQPLMEQFRGSRIVVGWNDPDSSSEPMPKGIRYFIFQKYLKNANHIGFRVYRSRQPRLRTGESTGPAG